MTAAGQTEWISWWLVALLAVGAGLGYLIAGSWKRTGDRLDHDLPRLLDDDTHCQIGDCREPAYSIYDRHPAGWIWVCRSHDAQVQAWVGPHGHVVSIEQEDQP